MTDGEEDPTFKLSNSSTKFAAKTNDIFGCLSVIERKHEAYQKVHSEDTALYKPDPVDEEDTHCITKEKSRGNRDRDAQKPYCRPQDAGHDRSTFTIPRPPPARQRGRRSVPDHRQNPDRWTKYTLDDISGNDMSETSNTQAAFAFLEERRKLKELAENPEAFVPANVDDTACSKGAITFVRKKADKPVLSSKKNTGVTLPQLDEEEVVVEGGEGSAGGVEKDRVSAKVAFACKKGPRKNIRSRQRSDDNDDKNDDENG